MRAARTPLWLLPLGLAGAAPAQSVAWRALTTPTPPVAAAFDSTRQHTVWIGLENAPRQWQWDGSSLEPRLQALGSTSGILWLGDDPGNRVLQALLLNPVRIGTWNGARWSFQTPAAAPALGATLRAAMDTRRRRIVVCQPNGASMDVHEWDGSAWWSSPAAPGPAGRTDAAFAFDPLGQRCVVYGGTGNGAPLADCWTWDGSTWTQLAAAAPPGPRAGAMLAFAPAQGGMVLYGGGPDTTTWRLLGATWQPVATAHTPGPRSFAHLVQDPHGLLLVGGAGDPLGTAWRFGGNDWAAVAAVAAPPVRQFAALAYDAARGQCVLFGGTAGAGAATHLFDTQWRGTRPLQSPPPRHAAQMCWSAGEQMVLLFGGIDALGGVLGDTWSWNGTDWLPRATAQAPSPRYGAQFVADPNGGVLLFGGWNGTTIFGDQWHWQGLQWTPRSLAVRPAPHAHGHAALDPLRNRVVMVAVPQIISDTWEWDGASWTLAASNPATSYLGGRRLGFDPRRGRVVTTGQPAYEWTGSSWVALATVAPPTPAGVATDTARQRLLLVAMGPAVAVHEFTATPAATAAFGYGCAQGPPPVLAALHDPTPGNHLFALDLAAPAPLPPSILLLGFLTANTPLGAGCTLLVGQPVATRFAPAAASGGTRYPVPIPNDPGLCGVEFTAQGAVLDPQQSLLGTATLTAGLRITVGH